MRRTDAPTQGIFRPPWGAAAPRPDAGPAQDAEAAPRAPGTSKTCGLRPHQSAASLALMRRGALVMRQQIRHREGALRAPQELIRR